MIKNYQCNKCGNIYKEFGSDKFIKATLKKCPMCGSTDVSVVNKRNKKG